MRCVGQRHWTCMRGAWLGLVGFVAIFAGCSSDPILTVDVKTDYAPVVDFAHVQTEVASVPFTSTAAMGMVVPDDAHAGMHYVDGVRIAEVHGLVAGDRYVRVSLLRADGAIVASRTTQLHFESSFALTVVLSRSCGSVVCPPAGGDATLTSCFGG